MLGRGVFILNSNNFLSIKGLMCPFVIMHSWSGFTILAPHLPSPIRSFFFSSFNLLLVFSTQWILFEPNTNHQYQIHNSYYYTYKKKSIHSICLVPSWAGPRKVGPQPTKLSSSTPNLRHSQKQLKQVPI